MSKNKLLNCGVIVLCLALILVAYFPSFFINNSQDEEVLRRTEGVKDTPGLVYCYSGILCQIHFLLMKGSYAHVYASGEVVVDIRGYNNGILEQDGTEYKRTLSSVVQHELNHRKQLSDWGIVRFFMTKNWIREGLAEQGLDDYSVNEFSLSDACSLSDDDNAEVKYAAYRVIIRSLLDEITESDIVSNNYRFEAAQNLVC